MLSETMSLSLVCLTDLVKQFYYEKSLAAIRAEATIRNYLVVPKPLTDVLPPSEIVIIDEKDIPFLALSIEFQAPLWTGDKTLKRGLLAKGYTHFFNPE